MSSATMDRIRMLDPIVASPDIEGVAAGRLSTLDGTVVGLYSNTKLNASKVLGMAAEIIQERFAPARFVLVEDNIDFGHHMNDAEHWHEPVDVALVAIGD
jgi:hypothetical protein